MKYIARIFQSFRMAFEPATPVRNRMLVEAIEPRILHSADISPLHLVDQSTDTVAETRYLGSDGEFINEVVQDPQQQSQEIIFVDTATPDYQQLIDQVVSGSDHPEAMEVVLIEADRDGIQTITDTLSSRDDLSAIHIISHGSDGQIQLGSTSLNDDSLGQRASEIAAWADAFSENGDILIYGCDVAATGSGQGLVDNLAILTRTDVAASEDLTGNENLGGDWDLEYRQGVIEARVLTAAAGQTSWNSLLVAPVIDLDADNSSGATGGNFQTVFLDAQIGGPVKITDTDLVISDVDSTNLTSAWVVLTNQQDGTNKETLAASAGSTGLTVTWTAANSTLTITGTGTLADYESVLSSTTYFNSQNNPNTTDRSIKFVAYDGTTVSSVATTTVRVIQSTPGNDVPVATNSLITGTEDTPYTFSATDFNYFDVEGDTLVSATISNLALAGGTLTYNSGTTLVAGSTLTSGQLDTLIYTPAPDANGSPLATFDFTVNDTGAGVVTATMGVKITPVNDAPVSGLPGTQTANEDTPLNIVGISASDIDGNLDSILVGVSNGTLSVALSGAASISAGANGSGSLTVSGTAADINATLASLMYLGGADFNGADTLIVTATDTSAVTDVANVAITVNPVNDPPVANDDTYTVMQDQTLVVNALTSNTTSSDLMAAWQFNAGAGATVVDTSGNGNDATLSGASWTASSRTGDSALSLDGSGNYIQTPVDLSTATSFTLSAWFQADTTAGQHHILWQGVSTQNGWGDPLDNSPTSSEMHLTVGRHDLDNKITFFLGYLDADANSIDITSASNFTDTSGWHQAVVVVSDLGGGTLQADLYVDGVLEGSDTGNQTDRSQWDSNLLIGRPGGAQRYFDGKIDDVGVYDRALTPAEVSALYQTGILANDSDTDGDTLSVNTTPVSNVSNGTLALNADGSFTYTPNPGFVGADTFTYEISDGNGGTSQATVNIAVVEPLSIVSRETADLNADGFIDAIHVTFNRAVDDATVSASDWNVAGVNGEAFSSTTNGDTANDADIYITFTDGVLDTGAKPEIKYSQGALADTAGMLLPSDSSQAWWDSAWLNRTKITFDNSSGTENLTDFPVLISLTATDIDFSKVGAGGSDIRFVDNDGTPLDYEIESWDDIGETATIWVRVQQLDAGSNTDYIHIYYNNPDALDAQTPDAVWDSGYAGVYHLEEQVIDEDTSGIHQDSAGTNDGAQSGNASTTGQIAGAQDFDGVNDDIDIGGLVGSTNSITLSGWIRHDGLTGVIERYITLENRAVIRHDGQNSIGQLDFYVELDGVKQHLRIDGALTAGVWHHVVGTWDGTTQRVYVDGVEAGSQSASGVLTTPTAGTISSASETMDGSIDEVRVSTVARSGEWIKASYRSQSGTFAFTSFGREEVGTADKAAPVLMSNETADINADGFIDAVHLTYSEAIDDATIVATDWTVTGVGGVTFSSTTNGDIADDADFYITFTDGVLDTGATPDVTYAQNAMADAAGNLAANTTTASIDAASPVLVSVNGVDAGTPGVFNSVGDTLDLVFSEAISAIPTEGASETNFVFSGVDSDNFPTEVGGDTIVTLASTDQANDTVRYTFSSGDTASSELTTDVTTIDVNVGGVVANSIEDAAGNDLIDTATGSPVSISWRVSPISDSDAAADEVAENVVGGTVVGVTAFARDPDVADNVSYSLLVDAGGRFRIDASTGVIAVDGSGPGLDYESASSHDITVQATSDDGSTSQRTFTISVIDANDAPVGVPTISGTVQEDQTLTADASGISDEDGLGAFSYQWLRDGAAITGATASTYTLGDADVGTQISVQVSYTDGNGTPEGPLTSAQTAAVANINDAPTTSAVTLAAIGEDSGARVITQAQLLSNANDVDGDPLTAQNLSISAGSGSLVDNLDGTWTYTPALNDDTAVSFSYDITDGTATINSGSASLDITPVNDAPTTSAVTLAAIGEDSGARVITQAQLLSNANDVDGDPLTAQNLSISAGSGSLVDNLDGTWTYTPALNDDTAVSFSYDITDGTATINSGSASLDITPVNDAPTTSAVTLAAIGEDSGARVITQAQLLSNANDVDGDPLTAQNLSISAGSGSLVDNLDGTWTYTPALNDDTAVSFSYDITDGTATINSGSASLDITPVNDAPTTSAVTLAAIGEDSGARADHASAVAEQRQ